MNLISILLNHLQCQTMWPAVFWAGPLAVPTQWSMLWISISTEADGHAEKMLNTMFNWNWGPDFQNFCPLRRCRGTADLTSISTRAEKRRWWCAQAAHMPLAVLIAFPLTSFPSGTVRVMHWGFIICSSPWHCEGGSRGHPRRELEIDNLASRTFRGFHDQWKPSSSYWVLDSSVSSGWDMYTYILSLAVKLMRTNRWNQNSNTFRQLAANNFCGPRTKRPTIQVVWYLLLPGTSISWRWNGWAFEGIEFSWEIRGLETQPSQGHATEGWESCPLPKI
jgi:hypothetical protein